MARQRPLRNNRDDGPATAAPARGSGGRWPLGVEDDVGGGPPTLRQWRSAQGAVAAFGSAMVLVLDLNDGGGSGSGGQRRRVGNNGSVNGGRRFKENGGDNILICGGLGKRRERRKKKT
jgi:hypothetical protein